MRVLVCGGRNYTNYARMKTFLDLEHADIPITTIIHGAAPGADSLANRWARENQIKVEAYPANWDMFGKAAGFLRNRKMAQYARPDLVIAFPGGRGTANMIHVAKEFNIPVLEVVDNG